MKWPNDGAQDFFIKLHQALDHEDAELHLQRRRSQWVSGTAVVPFWRQETQVEKFSFLHRDGVLATRRDKFHFPISIVECQFSDMQLTGNFRIDYKRDRLLEERLVPGGRHTMTVDGRWSLMDQWDIVPHIKSRYQNFELHAQTLPDVYWFELTLEQGINAKPVHLQFLWPLQPWIKPAVKAPSFNSGVHKADLSQFNFEQGNLSGEIQVQLNPDPWFPKTVQELTYRIKAQNIENTIQGQFEAHYHKGQHVEVIGQNYSADKQRPDFTGEARFEGAIQGRLLHAVSGYYRSNDLSGPFEGTLSGGFVRPSADILTMLERGLPAQIHQDECLNATLRIDQLQRQLRALSIFADAKDLHSACKAAINPGIFFEPETKVTADLLISLDRWSEQLVALQSKHNNSVQKPISTMNVITDPEFGPYYGERALPLFGDTLVHRFPEVVPQSGQHWQYLSHWRVLGPFPQEFIPSLQTTLPEVLPEFDFSYMLDPRCDDRVNAISTIRWQEIAIGSSEGRLQPPPWQWSKKGRSNIPGRKDSFWYASARFFSEMERVCYLSIQAADHGTLWLNRELLWVDREREWGLHRHDSAVLKVKLRAGENQFLVRCRDDRSSSWLKLCLAVNGLPQETPDKAPENIQVKAAFKENYYPAARPPLIWNLTNDTNVLWRTEVQVNSNGRETGVGSGGQTTITCGGPSPLICVGDLLLLNSGLHTLVAIDKNTGKVRWRRDSNFLELLQPEILTEWDRSDDHKLELLRKHGLLDVRAKSIRELPSALPVSDGKNIWVHYGTGVAACYNLQGERKWLFQTRMREANLILNEGQLIVAGKASSGFYAEHKLENPAQTENKGSRKAGSVEGHALLILDATNGNRIWVQKALRDFIGTPRLVHFDSAQSVLITGAAYLDLSKSAQFSLDLTPGKWDWQGLYQDGALLFMAHEGGQGALEFWANRDRQIGFRKIWQGERHHAFIAGSPNVSVSDQRLLYCWRRSPEHAKHCPCYVLQLDCFDRQTGQLLHRIKPVLRGTNVPLSPVIAGKYLFLADRRGGPHTGGVPAERQVAVVSLQPVPLVIARNPTPDLAAPMLFDEDKAYIVTAQGVVCVSSSPDRVLQDKKLIAQTILNSLSDEPKHVELKTIHALPTAAKNGVIPLTQLEDGQTITEWLYAGPFKPVDEKILSDALGQMAAVRPILGSSLTLAQQALPFKVLPDSAIKTTTSFHNDGRLDDWQLRRTSHLIDVKTLVGDQPERELYFYTELHNPRTRAIFSTMESPAVQVWLNNTELTMGAPIQVQPGIYALLLRIRPDYLDEAQQVRVDVLKARSAGVLLDPAWPKTWQVFGPLPAAVGMLEHDRLAELPTTVEMNGQIFKSRTVGIQGNTLSLANALMVGDESGSIHTPAKDHAAYLFATIEVPSDGTLLINASADWYMAWYLNGRSIYNTLQSGNGIGAEQLTAHTFSAPVKKGRHTLAVYVKPGSKGWSLTCVGGFCENITPALSAAYPTPQTAHAMQVEQRIPLAFREIEHPVQIKRAWLERIRAHAERLHWINENLSGSEEARQAKYWLQLLE